MKSIARRFKLYAASAAAVSILTVGVSALHAQNQVTANVPFSFKAGGANLSAGHYRMAPNSLSSNKVLQLYNEDTESATLLMAQSPIYDSKDNRPRIVFGCVSDECAIYQIYAGTTGWQFSTPKLAGGEKQRLAVVYFGNSSAGE